MSQGNDRSESPKDLEEQTDELGADAELPPAPRWAPSTKIVVGVGLVISAALVVWISRGVLGTLALS